MSARPIAQSRGLALRGLKLRQAEFVPSRTSLSRLPLRGPRSADRHLQAQRLSSRKRGLSTLARTDSNMQKVPENPCSFVCLTFARQALRWDAFAPRHKVFLAASLRPFA